MKRMFSKQPVTRAAVICMAVALGVGAFATIAGAQTTIGRTAATETTAAQTVNLEQQDVLGLLALGYGRGYGPYGYGGAYYGGYAAPADYGGGYGGFGGGPGPGFGGGFSGWQVCLIADAVTQNQTTTPGTAVVGQLPACPDDVQFGLTQAQPQPPRFPPFPSGGPYGGGPYGGGFGGGYYGGGYGGPYGGYY